MNKQSKLNELKDMLRGIYADRIKEEDIEEYANDLYQTFFVRYEVLDDIFGAIIEHENDYGIPPEESELCYVYSGIIDALEDNENTARRLYQEFMFVCDDLGVAMKLLDYNSEWLTKEEIKAVKRRVWEVFDKDMLRAMGCDWEDV